MTVLRKHHKQLIRRGAHTKDWYASQPQQKFTTPQEFANTILLRQLRVPVCCVVLPMILCSTVRMTVRVSLPPPSWTRPDDSSMRRGEKAHACPIFSFRGLPAEQLAP